MNDEEFDVLKKPASETVIWRYMDFATFVSVLSKSALHFKRMDLLDDKFEGSIPKDSYAKTPSTFKALCKDLNLDYKKELKKLRTAHKTINDAHTQLVKANLKMNFLNCWTMNKTESVAMWRLYPEGVVFQSTFKRLSDSFVNKHDVSFGTVHYVNFENFETDGFDEVAFWHRGFPFMFKRTCFEYEKELRAIILTEPVTEMARKEYWWKNGIRGMPDILYQQVDLRMLVEKIHVFPKAGKWFEELVNTVAEKYGYKFEIRPSLLSDEPTF